jgi:phage tail sheath protein FI
VGNSLILTYWSKVDKQMTPRFAESILDSVNIWMYALVNEGKLLGGRVEMLAEENSVIDIMAGKITFHIYMTPPSPAKEIEFVQEYDVSYVTSAFGAAA